MLAAASETRMLHDRLEAVGRSLESDATPVSNQDLPTLLVALVAIPVGLIAVNVIKRLKTRGLFETTDQDLLAAKVIAAARVTFLAAMPLDTFDDMVTDLAWTTLPHVLSDNHVRMVRAKHDGFAKSLCNTTEEILEFGAAVLLLAAEKVFAFNANSRSAALPAEQTNARPSSVRFSNDRTEDVYCKETSFRPKR